jgi:hypothetical protein
MENFDLIRSFFNRLFPYEKKTLRRFLLLNEPERGISKSLKLFLLFEKKSFSEANEADFVKKLYGKTDKNNVEAFRKLLVRFRDKMYESNFLDVNIKQKENSSPYFSASLEVKKLVGVSRNVISKGIPLWEINRLVNRGISIARQFEFYDELIIFLKLKIHYNGFEEGFIKQNKLFEEIGRVEVCRKALFDSTRICYSYLFDLRFKSTDDLKIREEIRHASDTVKSLYDEFKLANLKYDWYLLEMQYCHYNLDYSKAEDLQKELLQFIFKTPALYQNNKIADGYMNLSYCQTFLYKFKEAIESISLALKFASVNINSINAHKETKVFAHLYLKEVETAIAVIDELLATGSSGNSQIEYSKRRYLLATAKFLMQDYKTSFKLLLDTREIENDKEGWNIGIRMLQIYLTLATEKVDLADQRIESLRKHIERTTKMKSVRKRDVVIFRLLNHLARSGFDFKEVWEDRQKDFNLLRSDDQDYRWIPRSHEIILFDQWFEAKVKGKPYDPEFPKPEPVLIDPEVKKE